MDPVLPHRRPRRHGLDVGADHASVDDTVTYVAGVECAEDLSLLKDKRSTDLNTFITTPLTDAASGCVLLGVSLGCISLCLVLFVKLLLSIFKGRVAIWMRFALNLVFRIPEIGNYVIVLFGCGITILMQSSSVTTSTLTPLVAVGPLRLAKTFPPASDLNGLLAQTISSLTASLCFDGTLHVHVMTMKEMIPPKEVTPWKRWRSTTRKVICGWS